MHTAEHGVHRIEYEHEEVYGLPGVCVFALSGPGVPNLRITPAGVEPLHGEPSPPGHGRIVFANGLDHASPMAFPIFNPNDARLPDWETRRRPPPDPEHLPAIRTMSHHFGVHNVTFHSGLFRNEPTVGILGIHGPGLPNLFITREGVTPMSGPQEEKGSLSLYFGITRHDLK